MEYEKTNGKEKFSILNRQHKVLFSFESEDNTPQRTLREAVRQGVSLAGADFNGSVFIELNDDFRVLNDFISFVGPNDDFIGLNDFSNADLRGADFSSSDLINANFKGADLREADLRKADLRGADFEGADLRDANVLFANFEGVNFNNTNLDGVDLALTGRKNKWYISREGSDGNIWGFYDTPCVEMNTRESVTLVGKLFRVFEATGIFIPQEARFHLYFYKKQDAKLVLLLTREITLSKEVLTSDYVVKSLEDWNSQQSGTHDIMLVRYVSVSGKTDVHMYDNKDAVVRRQIPGILYFRFSQDNEEENGRQVMSSYLALVSLSTIWCPFPLLENIELSKLNSPNLTKLIKSLAEAFQPKKISPENPEKLSDSRDYDFRIRRYKYGYLIDYDYLEEHRDEIYREADY